MKNRLLKENLPFISLYLIYTGLLFFLFYQQCTHINTALYFSDMRAYLLEIKGDVSGYSFPYPIFFVLSRALNFLFPLPLSVTIILSLLNSISVTVTYRYFKSVLKDVRLSHLVSAFATFAVFLVSMLYLSFDRPTGDAYGQRYLGVFSPNPFHNATYLATRPFSILLFLQFVKVIECYESCKKRDIALLSLYLILSALTKPSFVFVFSPVMAITMLIKWVQKKFHLNRTDLEIILSAIPTILVLLYQFYAVFKEGSGGGVKLGPGVGWHLWNPGIKSAVFLAALFPIFYLLSHIKTFFTNRLFRFSWITYVTGISSFYLLYEDGFRIWDANFAWGYMHGLFFVFFTSILLLADTFRHDRLRTKWYNWIAAAILGCHLVCGCYFLAYMLTGGSSSLF